jgi:hypothetical protein
MKAKIYVPSEKLLNSEYRKVNIEIRLDDECKNGHEDFAITGDFWDKDNFTREPNIGGCCHEEIVKLYPEFQIFVDLHLNSAKGVPMFAIANGVYYLQEGKFDVLKEHLMLSDLEIDIFKNCPDKLYFQYLIEKIKLPTRWEKKANKAIKLLESLTKEVYTDHSTKETFIFLTPEQTAEIEEKIKVGYYLPGAISKRKAEEKQAKKAKLISDLRDKAAKEKRAIDLELQLKLFVLSQNLPIDNLIYYTHTRILTFNWQNTSYTKNITSEQFARFEKVFNKSKFRNDGIQTVCK